MRAAAFWCFLLFATTGWGDVTDDWMVHFSQQRLDGPLTVTFDTKPGRCYAAQMVRPTHDENFSQRVVARGLRMREGAHDQTVAVDAVEPTLRVELGCERIARRRTVRFETPPCEPSEDACSEALGSGWVTVGVYAEDPPKPQSIGALPKLRAGGSHVIADLFSNPPPPQSTAPKKSKAKLRAK